MLQTGRPSWFRRTSSYYRPSLAQMGPSTCPWVAGEVGMIMDHPGISQLVELRISVSHGYSHEFILKRYIIYHDYRSIMNIS
jgi:hypothetical protein